MSAPKIIRFEPHDPGGRGLQPWDPIDPATLASGEPVQHGHLYHEEKARGYSAGVWDCTAMTEKFGPYPVNEFMLLLEGSVTMIGEDGTETVIRAGETFVIPKGLRCSWKQEGYVRKYFVIFEDPSGPKPTDPTSLALVLPRPEGPPTGLQKLEIADPSIFLGSPPLQHDHTYFEDATGQMCVGLWQSTPFERAVAPFPRNELMCLLEGSVTLTDGEGGEHHFRAGDVAYVPMGAPCGWRSTETVRKFYAIFEPSA